MHPLSFALALAVASLGGCGDDTGDAAAAELAAASAAQALEASLSIGQLGNRFEVSSELGPLALAVARARAIGDTLRAFERAVMLVDCLRVDSDGATFIELTFDACEFLLLGLAAIDGSLRAELDLETEPCGLATCVSAAVFELATDGLAIQRRGRNLELAGSWRLRAPVGDEPLGWTASYTATVDDGTRLFISSQASWRPRGECVDELSFDAEVTVESAADELGALAISASGLSRCRAACPTAGELRLSFARGDVLAWRYDGAAVTDASGPRGVRLAVDLACAP